jgi:DNA-binding MarR family transcriptional regulator
MKRDLLRLREALLDLTGVLNRPQPDAALIALAGVDLDRALFALLVRVERRGPLAIGELAELTGRDYSTVSRQISKLENLGLVVRQVDARDARVTTAVVTKQGRVMTRTLDRAREKLMTELLGKWDKKEVAQLARLLRRFADDALRFTRAERSRSRTARKVQACVTSIRARRRNSRAAPRVPPFKVAE